MSSERTTGVAHDPGSSVTVTDASSTVVPARANRLELILTNDHATGVIWLRLGPSPATLNDGIRLAPAGGSITLTTYKGEVRAISNVAGSGLLVADI